MSPRLRLASLGLTLAALAVAVALSGSLSSASIHDRLDGYGAAGPLVFVAVSSLLTVVLFPGPLLAGAAGLLFGTALGTPVAIVSATLGASLAFMVSRRWAHDAVVQLAGDEGTVARVRAWIGRRGFVAVLYARIAPGIPYSLVNYAAGLSPVRLRTFAAATAIGVSPRAFAYVALGGSLGNLGSPEAIVAMAVLVVMAVIGLVLLRRSAPGRGSSTPGRRSAAPP